MATKKLQKSNEKKANRYNNGSVDRIKKIILMSKCLKSNRQVDSTLKKTNSLYNTPFSKPTILP